MAAMEIRKKRGFPQPRGTGTPHKIQATPQALGRGQDFGSSEELNRTFGAGVVEEIEEFGAEHDGESAHVKQKVGTCGNPAGAVEGKRAARDQTVQMKMIQQDLIPGVEHGKEPDSAFQVGSSEIGKSLRHGFEEDVQQNLLVGQDQRIQFMGNRKDQMEVADRKKFGRLCLQPLFSSGGTTLGTMPVPARMETGTLKAAGIASLEMTTQSFGSAHFDRMHDLAVSGRQRITVPVVVAVKAEHIGHFPSGPAGCRRLLSGLHGLDVGRFGRNR